MNYVTLIICCSKVQNQPLHGKSKSIVQRAIKLQLVRFPKKPWQLQIIQLMGHTITHASQISRPEMFIVE